VVSGGEQQTVATPQAAGGRARPTDTSRANLAEAFALLPRLSKKPKDLQREVCAGVERGWGWVSSVDGGMSSETLHAGTRTSSRSTARSTGRRP
jgi:hypothetical protein